MATYTATELKDLTSVASVGTWSNAKILLKQTMAEAILSDMDSSVSGYAEAYPAAVVAVFDWLCDNPTGRTADSQGKSSRDFSVDDLPITIRKLIDKYLPGSNGGGIVGAPFQRSDIGLR